MRLLVLSLLRAGQAGGHQPRRDLRHGDRARRPWTRSRTTPPSARPRSGRSAGRIPMQILAAAQAFKDDLRERGQGARAPGAHGTGPRRDRQGQRADLGRPHEADAEPPSGRRGARTRHRRDARHPQGQRRIRPEPVQRGARLHQGRHQARRRTGRRPDRAAPCGPRAGAQGAGRAMAGASRPNRTSTTAVVAAAESLEDLLARETFFRELPAIDQACRAGSTTEYAKRIAAALAARAEAYDAGLQRAPRHARAGRTSSRPPER